MITDADTSRAYWHCTAITRSAARNFYYGISLLPKDKRVALCAVYALARRIDDIGDEPAPPAEKRAALDAARRALSEMDTAADPVLIAVADAARRYPIPLPAFTELVDGVALDVEMDLTERRYADFGELVRYCRRVAGSIGRLCLGVFGCRPDPEAPRLADALGIALQQVNILRDIREDLTVGRVYLPQEDLDRFGVRLALDERGRLIDPEHRLAALVSELAERARWWFGRGQRLLPLLDRRSAACCGTMSGIYRGLLDRIAADPTLVFDQRLSLSTRHKAAIAGRALLGVAR
ncbi:presqualene diphosphate synthase HpnD [Allokutzneria oryzae]|uniref:Presqualene diphosphate synthase HpnD n=1 Tax=Allokutzneria oryzae TaxID=1378989 RepID=A0ABV5ZYL0_9PSEU